jgi:hypothetical protein
MGLTGGEGDFWESGFWEEGFWADDFWAGGGSSQLSLSERCCGTHSWRTNAGAPRLALGTPTKLYVYSAGALDDITPSAGFTAGDADADFEVGNFGAGLFGAGPFGIGDDSLEALTEANTWQIDNYGEDLVAVALADGDLWYYDQSAGGNLAEITPSEGTVPTSNLGVVVTPEHFIVVLGAGGLRRRIQWPDQSDHTDWDFTSPTNSAGQLDLPGKGAILAARRTQAETLIWTETALYALRYIGGQFVYSPVPVGEDGAISRRSMMVIGKGAMWMGQRGFYVYDGYSQPIPCPLADYVFSDMNRVQASKIWAESRAEYGEVIWHYPSGTSTECNRAVVYNFRSGIWYPWEIARTGGEDRGALMYPVAVDPAGLVWQHESGRLYPGVSELPYAESGPREIGGGDRVMFIREVIPDERTLGELDLRLYLAMYPKGDETEVEVDVTGAKEDVRQTARQVRFRVETSPDQEEADWRLGTIRFEVVPGGLR